MTYTIWHDGIMIGESDFDRENPDGNPRQRAGIFTPTSYGQELFPRLTGILTASSALKDELEAQGLDPDEMDRDEVANMMETSAAGQKVIDIGRVLSQVEIRDERSHPLRFKQIAFIDLNEIRALARKLGAGEDKLDSVPDDASALVVSATLSDDSEWSQVPALA